MRQRVFPQLRMTNWQRTRAFYVDGLGFKMTNQWVHEGKLRWCKLDLGGATVMLQEFWKEGDHRNVPESEVGVGVGISFFCKDALTLWCEFVSRGVQATRPIVGNGLWGTELTDPDGYKLYFQSPTDAPEETVFSEGE